MGDSSPVFQRPGLLVFLESFLQRVYNENTTAVEQVGQVRGHSDMIRGVRQGCFASFFFCLQWPWIPSFGGLIVRSSVTTAHVNFQAGSRGDHRHVGSFSTAGFKLRFGTQSKRHCDISCVTFEKCHPEV